MKLLSFLNNREIGAIRRKFNSFDQRPNLDNLLFRLACKDNDVYSSERNYVPPLACKFRKDKSRDLLAVSDEDGVILLIDTDCKGILDSFIAHNNAVFDICWLPDKCHLITASGDSTARLWDMNTFQMISCFNKHVESIKSVDVCPNDTNLFATGSRDGTICVWDTRVKCCECGNALDKPSISISFAHKRVSESLTKDKKVTNVKQSLSSVSAVAFQNDRHLVSAGAADGVVKVWDLRKSYICKGTHVPTPRYQMKYMDDKSGHGCTSLAFDSAYKKLYGCSTANKIFQFDCHLFSDPVSFYEGFRCDTYFVKVALSSDDQYLVSGSSDQKAYIWKTTKPGLPIMELPGHTSEVTAVSWGSYDTPKIVTCGDDDKILLWKTVNQECPEDLKDTFAVPSVYNNEKRSQEEETSNSCLISYKSLDNHTPIFKTVSKVSTVTSIKSFFQPLLPGTSASNLDSLSSVLEAPLLKNTETGISLPDQNILSPSKIVNRNETVSPESLVLHKTQSNSCDKENRLGNSSKVTSNVGTSGTQVKRKLLSSDSTPKSEKTPCIKKGKRSSRSADKKKNERNSGSIMDYFTVSLSPEE